MMPIRIRFRMAIPMKALQHIRKLFRSSGYSRKHQSHTGRSRSALADLQAAVDGLIEKQPDEVNKDAA